MRTIGYAILVIIAILLVVVLIATIYEYLKDRYMEKHKFDIIFTKETHRKDLEDLTENEKGEFLLCMAMNQLKEYKRANFNVFFRIKGGNTKVDAILVHKTGIYVFENKFLVKNVNVKWDDDNWYQKTFLKPVREFYNPIKQGRRHIHVIKEFMEKRGFPKCPIYSIIAFADDSKVKQQKREEENTYVCKYSDIKQIIKSITAKMDPENFLTEDQIIRYHWAFDTLSHVTQEVKDNHVEYVRMLKRIKA